MLYEIQAGRLRYEQAEDTMGEEIAIIAHNEMIAQLNEEDAFDRLLIKACRLRSESELSDRL